MRMSSRKTGSIRTSCISGPSSACSSASNGGQSWAQFKPNNFPDGLAVRDIALQDREDDLVLATHGRGIWVIDDISPLRALTSATLASAATLIPGRPVEQRIQGNGGWAEGDATYYGDNPPSGAIITYYQKARHVIGRMKLEILDANGNVVDEVPASKRRGLNRVSWSMRTKPPHSPAGGVAGRFFGAGRALPSRQLHRAADQGGAGVDRAADRHARQARDLLASPTARRNSQLRNG